MNKSVTAATGKDGGRNRVNNRSLNVFSRIDVVEESREGPDMRR